MATCSEPSEMALKLFSSLNDKTDEEELDLASASKVDIALIMKKFHKTLNKPFGYCVDVEFKDTIPILIATKSFEELNLNPKLLKGLYNMGFNAPSQIQERMLPILLSNPPRDLVAQSQNGTGKTAAFVVAMFSRINPKLAQVQAVVLSPTYELAIQTGETAAKIGQFMPEITLRYCVRGVPIPENGKVTEHIVIGTTGKILDWTIKYKLFDLSKLSVFILDEAGAMLSFQGFKYQCVHIYRELNPAIQKLLISATYAEDVKELAAMIMPQAAVLKLKPSEEIMRNIRQFYIKCSSSAEKIESIRKLYGELSIGQAIIFCHTRASAALLYEQLTLAGHSVAVISGDLTVEERLKVLDRFRKGLEKVLIATNVVARGIDIEQVTLVVNYDLPLDREGHIDGESYVHRIGRCGRFGRISFAVTLINTESLAQLTYLEKTYKVKIRHLDLDNAQEYEDFKEEL